MEVVVGALPRLLPKLGQLLAGEYNLQKDVKGGIIFLQAELEFMQGALEKISKTPEDQLDNQDKIWGRAVRDMSYDIEDIVDTYMVRCKGSELQDTKGRFKKLIDRSLEIVTRTKIRRNLGKDIRDMKIRVKEVAERRDRYKMGGDDAKPVMATTIDPRICGQYRKAEELVGINEARDEMIKNLTSGDEMAKHEQGKIVSIVGFGGLGKTTLAKAVYEKIGTTFECKAFVSVSRTPDFKNLFKAMLDDLLGKKTDDTMDVERLIEKLRQFLEDKRYIIVMDDIWDIEHWKWIRCALPDNNAGYIIMTTTRNLGVAEHIGGAYKLQPLSLQNSKILFYGRIFGNEGNGKCPDEGLAEVSNKILKKCAGVPLAIITIASLLESKPRDKMEWYEVHNSIGTGLLLEDNQDLKSMKKILSLSYYDLPPHLRTCLLYMSVFPEDHEIEKDLLIWMWIGEGFIQSGKQGRSLFEIGESYLNELINRSMIQPVYNYIWKDRFDCRVHDMVLDLVCYLSAEENFVTILSGMNQNCPSKKDRRLSLQRSNIDHATIRATMSMSQGVRSVVVFGSAVDLIVPSLHGFRVLRVLCLFNVFDSWSKVSFKGLGNLVHLRHLMIRGSGFQLPDEIGNLRFLRILDVASSSPWNLPSTVVQLKDLICLKFNSGFPIPKGLRSLTSLEVLQFCWTEDDQARIIEELGHLTELRVLSFSCYTEWDEWDDSLNKSLVDCLCNLRKIRELDITIETMGTGECNLDSWVAPPHLRRLRMMSSCWLSTLSAWVPNPSLLLDLSFLEIIVRDVQQEDFQILGRLPALYHLVLESKNRLGVRGKFFTVGAGSFSCLERCKLKRPFLGHMVFLQGAMPMVTTLEFEFHEQEEGEITGTDGAFDMGLGYLPSLQYVIVRFDSRLYSKEEVNEATAVSVLRHAIEIHPNHPTFKIFTLYGWSDE